MDTREFQAPTSADKRVEDFIDANRPEEKVRAAWNKVQPLLVAGEKVEHLLVQGIAAMKLHSGSLVLTNRRAIFLQPGLMKMTFLDLLWRNLVGCHLVESITGAEVILQEVSGRVLRMACLPKDPARPAYAYAQQLEELAAEFRRQRALEETRAAARGYATHPPESLAPQSASLPDAAPVRALEVLKDLRTRDLIDEQTYQAKRAEILARL